MASKTFRTNKFESVIILDLEKAPTKTITEGSRRRRKRALPPIIGVNAVAMIR